MRRLLSIAVFSAFLAGIALAADETVAHPGDNLAAKLREATSGTGVLYITKGPYALGEPMIVTRTVTIRGAGRELVYVYPTRQFAADAMIEVVAGAPGNIRGVHISGFQLDNTSPSTAPLVKCGILLGRDSNSCESRSHLIEQVGVIGRFQYGYAVIGTELTEFRNCDARCDVQGGVGLYASPLNRPGLRSARLNKVIAGGTTTYDRMSGGYLTGGPGGYSVRCDGYVVAWTFTGVFFGGASGVGSDALIRLHGLESPSLLLVPSRLTFIGCGNDSLGTQHGLMVTSERTDRVGADRLSLDNCYWLSQKDPLYAKTQDLDPSPDAGRITNWQDRNGVWLKNGLTVQPRP